jgi:hypothetical protein
MFSKHENQTRVLNKFKNSTAYNWTKLEKRLQKYIEDTQDGHSIWTKKKKSLIFNGQLRFAITWVLMCIYRLEEIPAGFTTLRFCNNSNCCKPEHIDIVTIGKPEKEDILESDYYEAKLYLNKNSITDEKTGCRIWQKACGEDGLGRGSFRVPTSAHLISYNIENRTLFEFVPKKQAIRHLCGNKKCIEISHLKLGKQGENGATKIGEKHPSAKITEEIAQKIIDSYEFGNRQERVDLFGLSYSLVEKIDHGSTWCHLPRKRKKLYGEEEEFYMERKVKKTSGILMKSEEDFAKAREKIQMRIEKICDLKEKKEHWLWTDACNVKGYGVIKMFQCNYQAHSLSYLAHNKISTIKKGLQVRHKCRFRKCVNPDCLELGTAIDNAHDRLRDGTNRMGDDNPNAKITSEIAMKIFEEDRDDLTQVEIAAKYQVSRDINRRLERIGG